MGTCKRRYLRSGKWDIPAMQPAQQMNGPGFIKRVAQRRGEINVVTQQCYRRFKKLLVIRLHLSVHGSFTPTCV